MGPRNFLCSGILLFALFGSTVPIPAPLPAPFMLEDYDLQSLKDDFDAHPVVSTIRSGVHESLATKPVSTAVDKAVSDEEQRAIDATTELDILLQLLDQNSKYMESRDNEDPSWPKTIASKIGSNTATPQEKLVFQEDLYHAISTVVILKMMEERVSLINKFLEDHFMESPDADIDGIFGGNDALAVAEGLLALKFLEGFLHSTNVMIDEVLVNDTTAPVLPVINPTSSSIIIPSQTEDDDMDLGIAEFIFLVFTAIGFFFVIFTVIYSCLKMVQMCFDCMSTSSKKSKYEQI